MHFQKLKPFDDLFPFKLIKYVPSLTQKTSLSQCLIIFSILIMRDIRKNSKSWISLSDYVKPLINAKLIHGLMLKLMRDY